MSRTLLLAKWGIISTNCSISWLWQVFPLPILFYFVWLIIFTFLYCHFWNVIFVLLVSGRKLSKSNYCSLYMFSVGFFLTMWSKGEICFFYVYPTTRGQLQHNFIWLLSTFSSLRKEKCFRQWYLLGIPEYHKMKWFVFRITF